MVLLIFYNLEQLIVMFKSKINNYNTLVDNKYNNDVKIKAHTITYEQNASFQTFFSLNYKYLARYRNIVILCSM